MTDSVTPIDLIHRAVLAVDRAKVQLVDHHDLWETAGDILHQLRELERQVETR